MTEDMFVMDQPARSLDRNITENVWDILASRFYQGGPQFGTIEDLKECLLCEWEKLTIDKIRNLILSVPRRVVNVIIKCGGETNYQFRINVQGYLVL